MQMGEENELQRMLVKLQEKCGLAWVSLSTSSLLERNRPKDLTLTDNMKVTRKTLDILMWIAVTVMVGCGIFISVDILHYSRSMDSAVNVIMSIVGGLSGFLLLLCFAGLYKLSGNRSAQGNVVLHDTLAKVPGYSKVHLQRNMRSTGNIASASLPQDLNSYGGVAWGSVQTGVLPPLIASTVPGERPFCILSHFHYHWTQLFPFLPQLTDYTTIARGIQHGLNKLFHLPNPATRPHVAILCGVSISPRLVAKHLQLQGTTVYDAGVKYFDGYGNPKYHKSTDNDTQRKSVATWLTGKGGLLVTHNSLFNGMEVGYAIYVTRRLTDMGSRSALLRAIGALCVVTDSFVAKEDSLGRNFTVVTCSDICECLKEENIQV